MRMAKPRLKTSDFRTVKPRPKQADPELQTRQHEAWAREVKHRAGYRCQAPGCHVHAPPGSGIRLFADHIKERKDGGAPLDPRNGQALCGKHHTIKTAQARQERAGS